MLQDTLTGLGFFCEQVIHLISLGKKEMTSIIEEHLDKKDLIEYISTKYSKDFLAEFPDTRYNFNQLNKLFSNNDFIPTSKYEKYGLMNDDDGLLEILAIVANEIEYRCKKWSAE
jgi:hypothetical protein